MPSSRDADTALRGEQPLIGVSGPSRGGLSAWLLSRWALERAGARALRITPHAPFDIGSLDGLVLGGGADVAESLGDPEEPAPPPSNLPWPRRVLDLLVAPPLLLLRLAGKTQNHGMDPARDALESSLIAHARVHDLPVLGICRGAQLMSLAEGGTLSRNVHTLYTERPHLYTVLPRREVHLEQHATLARILGCHALLVNSLHFHAVEQPGRTLQVAAREPSGVIQAIEDPKRRFWVGVQWHPEYLPQQRIHQRLFQELVQAARARRSKRALGRASEEQLA